MARTIYAIARAKEHLGELGERLMWTDYDNDNRRTVYGFYKRYRESDASAAERIRAHDRELTTVYVEGKSVSSARALVDVHPPIPRMSGPGGSWGGNFSNDPHFQELLYEPDYKGIAVDAVAYSREYQYGEWQRDREPRICPTKIHDFQEVEVTGEDGMLVHCQFGILEYCNGANSVRPYQVWLRSDGTPVTVASPDGKDKPAVLWDFYRGGWVRRDKMSPTKAIVQVTRLWGDVHVVDFAQRVEHNTEPSDPASAWYYSVDIEIEGHAYDGVHRPSIIFAALGEKVNYEMGLVPDTIRIVTVEYDYLDDDHCKAVPRGSRWNLVDAATGKWERVSATGAWKRPTATEAVAATA